MDPKTIIVDIDGTLSQPGERLKYLNQQNPDWDSFYEDSFKDKPILQIVELVKTLGKSHEVIYCTGRRESVRYKTMGWLYEYNLPKGALLMRKDGDFRHDTEVKPELLLEYFSLDVIEIDHHVLSQGIEFILEDRNSMVKRWRELGYICLQVADGDF